MSALEETGDEEERQAQDAGEIDDKRTVRPTGRVVGIIQRNWRKCCGSLELSSHHGTALNAPSACLVVPVDRKMPKIKIQTRQQEALAGKRLLVEIGSWPVDSNYPWVTTCALGGIGDEITETDVLLIEHNIARNDFSVKWCVACHLKTGRSLHRTPRGVVICVACTSSVSIRPTAGTLTTHCMSGSV